MHIPWIFADSDSDHQVSSHHDDIPAAPTRWAPTAAAISAIVAVLNEWQRFVTPSEYGVRRCRNNSGPIRDLVLTDESTVGRLVECLRSGNKELERLVDLLTTDLICSTARRG